ncbi:BlaI/MecI/CopY family transcriptional regulator [Murinocardiopsis flavida]|nr:BlaI/MecI/CopY family transcriptional regulator [Murinocardiopsis flavida]
MKEFGELESAIMSALWSARRPLVVREVRELMTYDRDVAYTTVMTVANILYHKGLLRREKAGRAWQYWPHETRDEHTARLMREVLSGSEDPGAALLRFIERFTDEEVGRLGEMLHKVRAQRSVA